MSHEEAVKIDTQLAEIWGEHAGLLKKLEQRKDTLNDQTSKLTYSARKMQPFVSLNDLIFKARVLLAWGDLSKWEAQDITETLATISQIRHDLYVNAEQSKPGEAIFAANRWSRFFLVNNTNGHIHSSMNCSTCNMRTNFSWLPNLSGLTEKDAVEEHGPLLCTVCYPSAPTEWTLGHVKDTSDQCPGSGTYQENPSRRRYLTCDSCSKVVNVTSTGKLRSHKKEAA